MLNSFSVSRRSTPAFSRRSLSRDVTPRPTVRGTPFDARASLGPNQLRKTPQPPAAASKPTKSSKPQCENRECSNSDVVDDDGKLICRTCGFILQETQITQELTFGEAANGAAVVQGVYVGANDESARISGMAGPRFGSGMTSRQISERDAADQMNVIVNRVGLGIADKDRGMQVYKLAMAANMVQGRTIREVAGACLYVGCRRDPECQVMLIDFSEILGVNVFKLGDLYKTIVNKLALNEGGNVPLYEANPETLIQRFARDLEFGNDEHRIVREAIQILKRMKRDWILVGRRPAGVCGAALILAARMNNYRRTVREVVYTAKVADVTINKRLDEFQFTESSKLTVDEFRHHGLALEREHDPPAFYEQFTTKKRRSKRQKQPETQDERAADANSVRSSVSPSPVSNPARKSMVPPESTQSTRFSTQEEADRRAMPPPNIPIDPLLLRHLGQASQDGEVSSTANAKDRSDEAPPAKRRKPGRPAGAKNKPLPEKTAKAIQDEAQIEADMQAILHDPQAVAEAADYHQSVARKPISEPTQPVSSATRSEQEQAPITESQAPVMPSAVAIDGEELDDDPEVRDCLLSPEEQAIKEQIWVTENSKWLADVQSRQIKKELAERSGITNQAPKRIRRRGRMGDMSHYQVTREDGSIGPPSSAEEATRMMMEKRGYSKRINYDAIRHLYSSKSTSRSPSTDASSRASSVQRSPPPLSLLAPGPSTYKRTKEKSAAAQKTTGPARGKPATARQNKKSVAPNAATQQTSNKGEPAGTHDQKQQEIEISKRGKEKRRSADEYANERRELEELAKEGKPPPEEDDYDMSEDEDSDSDIDDDSRNEREENRRVMYGSTEDDESDYGDEV